MRRSIVALLALLISLPALAQPAHRVADINTTQEDFTDPLLTQGFAVLGTTVVFLQDDGVHGVEPWKSDGTPAGTLLLKDVCPGVCWSSPRMLTVSNGFLYFSADDGVHGRELWRTDGTAPRTSLVVDLNPGVNGSDPSLLEAGGILYLSADDGVHGRELWKTDGTIAGTQLVADIQPGPVGSDPRLWLDTGGKLLLNADDGVHGREPWISDGTGAGTTLLADVQPGAGSSSALFAAFNTFETDAISLGGGAFLFAADDGVHGIEPWVSDGTPGGTALLLDINPGSDTSFPHGFLRLGSRILFGAFEPSTGSELWSTDGTAAGTALLKDVDPNVDNGNIRALTAAGSEAYFASFDGTPGLVLRLWKTDGTAAGTVEVNPGADPNIEIINLLPTIQPFNGGVLFFGEDAAHGVELWQSDGTAAGTTLVKDVQPGTGWGIGRGASGIAVVGGTAYFRGVTTAHGSELWKTDGTTAGTAEVENVQALASSIHVFNNSSAGHFQNLGGKLLCNADDGVTGVEPWVSDGTAAGTVRLGDLAPGPDWSFPVFGLPVGGTNVLASPVGLWATDGTPAGTSQLLPGTLTAAETPVSVLGKVFFAGTSSNNTALWQTDGTAAGTAPVGGYNPSTPVSFGSLLLYTADAVSNDFYPELWRTDGTAPGTYALTAAHQTLGQPVPLSSVALFAADDPGSGTELWSTDGTTGGTGLLKDLEPGAGSSDPQELVRLGAVALFTASDSTHGRELWASDGTAAGTVLLADIQPGTGSAFGVFPAGLSVGNPPGAPGSPAVIGGTLFFVADDGTHGRELWKTDGTAAGTALVLDINPGSFPSDPTDLTVANGRLFFVADDGTHGRELWVSDGATAGTRMVQDIMPGAGSSAIQQLQALDHLVLFSADDGSHGRELWRSDGVAVGTFLVQDIAPGAAPSSPLDIAAVGSDVFFAANDGMTGFEPWVISRDFLLTTFQDVPPSYFAWRFIEALVVQGVTGGCGNGDFCPDQPITRAEMAVLLLTARGTTPPPATGTRFDDVPPGYWAGAWIEELAREGVVSGCSANPPLYCPESNLTRAEMAVLLTVARHENPPPATGTRFADVPAGYWAARFIEQLAADGITGGCGGGNYCPDQPVTRGQMAVFLTTAFHLQLP